MISIQITPPKTLFANATSAIQGALEQAVNDLGVFAMSKIGEIVNNTLHSSAPEYLRGLQDAGAYIASKGRVEVTLIGDLPNALEQGFDSFDMKPGLLAKAKKSAADGSPIVDVPFRHRESTMSDSATSAMRSAVSQARKVLGKSSDYIAVRSSFKGTAESKAVEYGGKRVAVQHRASKETAMIRTPLHGGRGHGGQLMTFRRLTSASPPSSWIHPGFSGIGAFRKAADEVEKIKMQVIKDRLKEIGVT